MRKCLEELRRSHFHEQLGQKLCAAYIAQQQGIALDTALKKVAVPVGDFWLVMAELARKACTENAEMEDLGPTAATYLGTGHVI
jgi:hypothetical protein